MVDPVVIHVNDIKPSELPIKFFIIIPTEEEEEKFSIYKQDGDTITIVNNDADLT